MLFLSIACFCFKVGAITIEVCKNFLNNPHLLLITLGCSLIGRDSSLFCDSLWAVILAQISGLVAYGDNTIQMNYMMNLDVSEEVGVQIGRHIL